VVLEAVFDTKLKYIQAEVCRKNKGVNETDGTSDYYDITLIAHITILHIKAHWLVNKNVKERV
jgi:hypothetical protein